MRLGSPHCHAFSSVPVIPEYQVFAHRGIPDQVIQFLIKEASAREWVDPSGMSLN